MTYTLIERGGMAALSANRKVPKFITMAGRFTNSESGMRPGEIFHSKLYS